MTKQQFWRRNWNEKKRGKIISKKSDTESIKFFIALDANNSDGLGGIGPEVITVRFSESLVPCMASSIQD